MIDIRFRHLFTAGAAACVLAVAGCGGSDDEPEGAKLPAAAVRDLDLRLDEIQRRYDVAKDEDNPGACDDIAQDSFPAVKKIIDGLPQDVDSKLREATTESFANLQQLTDEGCQDVSTPTETQTETTPPETTPPETTPPETTPPETTPPETTPPQTTPDTGGTGGQNPNGGSPQGGGTEAPSGDGN